MLKFIPVVFLISILFALSPIIKQDDAYHNFADKRVIFIPNFFDVSTNIIFLIIGILNYKNLNFIHNVFNISIILVFLGSSYYHYNPNNYTLIFDRLPMTVGFMALLSVILQDNINQKLFSSRQTQIFLIAVGLWSILYWVMFEDLKLYILIQFGAIGVALYYLYRNRKTVVYSYNYNLLLATVWYIMAKVFELCDHQVYYLMMNLISGHSLKHLVAGIGCWYAGEYIRKVTKVAKKGVV